MHELKTWPEHFIPVAAGMKTAEVRKNDRKFVVGDRLRLREWDPETRDYTGRQVYAVISHILRSLNVAAGYVVLSIKTYPEEPA